MQVHHNINKNTISKGLKMETLEKIVPQIHKIEIGRKTLETLEILPISLASLIEMSKIIEDVAEEFLSTQVTVNGTLPASADIKLGRFILSTIKDNIVNVLKYVVDEDIDIKDLMKKLTLAQTIEIAEKIYEVNWEAVEKKLKEGILKRLNKVKESIPSEKS
jgi:hypothetical protein